MDELLGHNISFNLWLAGRPAQSPAMPVLVLYSKNTLSQAAEKSLILTVVGGCGVPGPGVYIAFLSLLAGRGHPLHLVHPAPPGAELL